MGGHLRGSLGALLHARPYAHAAAPGSGDRRADLPPGEAALDLLANGAARKSASAPKRTGAPETSDRAPTRNAARERLGVLAALPGLGPGQAGGPDRGDLAHPLDEVQGRARSGLPDLSRPRADPG